MKCAFCGSEENKVVDSRETESGAIRRRRECSSCHRRFTTYETVEFASVFVVKNNGERQAFSPAKVRNGILKACEKRPVSINDIENLVSDIEAKVYAWPEREISTKQIGEFVMDGLKKLDEVSYVRFASVYKKFKDVATFFEFVNEYEKMLRDN